LFRLIIIYGLGGHSVCLIWMRRIICLLNLLILLSEMASFWSTKKFLRSWSFFNTSLSFGNGVALIHKNVSQVLVVF